MAFTNISPFTTLQVLSSAALNAMAANATANRDGSSVFCTFSGTNTITATSPLSITALLAGLVIRGRIANTNTGATTVALDGLAPVAIKKISTTGYADVVAGDLVANQMVELIYDSVGPRFVLATSAASQAGSLSIVASGTQAVGANARASVNLLAGADVDRFYMLSVRDSAGSTWAWSAPLGSGAGTVSPWKAAWIERGSTAAFDLLWLSNQTTASATAKYSVALFTP